MIQMPTSAKKSENFLSQLSERSQRRLQEQQSDEIGAGRKPANASEPPRLPQRRSELHNTSHFGPKRPAKEHSDDSWDKAPQLPSRRNYNTSSRMMQHEDPPPKPLRPQKPALLHATKSSTPPKPQKPNKLATVAPTHSSVTRVEEIIDIGLLRPVARKSEPTPKPAAKPSPSVNFQASPTPLFPKRPNVVSPAQTNSGIRSFTDVEKLIQTRGISQNLELILGSVESRPIPPQSKESSLNEKTPLTPRRAPLKPRKPALPAIKNKDEEVIKTQPPATSYSQPKSPLPKRVVEHAKPQVHKGDGALPITKLRTVNYSTDVRLPSLRITHASPPSRPDSSHGLASLVKDIDFQSKLSNILRVQTDPSLMSSAAKPELRKTQTNPETESSSLQHANKSRAKGPKRRLPTSVLQKSTLTHATAPLTKSYLAPQARVESDKPRKIPPPKAKKPDFSTLGSRKVSPEVPT